MNSSRRNYHIQKTMAPPGVPLIYRVFLLYVDPLLALGGVCLAYFQPEVFMSSIVPASLASTFQPSSSSSSGGSTALIQLMLTSIASLYLLFAINSLLVLRLAPDVAVWRAVSLAYLASDLGHSWAFYAADRQGFWRFDSWRVEDWFSVGTLFAGILLRSAFLCGLGVKAGREQGEERKAGKKE
jgi:hypothetical protein